MSTTRIQLALNVDDVPAAIAFYEKMFGVPPHKVRDGYANFAIENPPLKLVLIEKPGATERLNHLGVEAATPLTCRRRCSASRRPAWRRPSPSRMSAATPPRTRCS